MGENVNSQSLSRRKLIKGISVLGAGTAISALYQNCADRAFQSNTADLASSGVTPLSCPTTDPNVIKPLPVCSREGNLLDGKPVQKALPGDEHELKVKYYKAKHYSHALAAETTQPILTIEVGANPAEGLYHPLDFHDFKNVHAITDLFVIDKMNCEIVLWKRFSTSDQESFAYMILPQDLVERNAELKIVASCSTHGLFGVDYSLMDGNLSDYSSVVGTFNQTLPFGGSTLKFPYLSVEATGGQGNIGPLHAVAIEKISNDEVHAILGGTQPHGRYGENHYINGGVIFDQNGQMLTQISLIRYGEAGSSSTGPTLKFTKLKLAERGVTHLRIAIFDTYNGYLQGFLKI